MQHRKKITSYHFFLKNFDAVVTAISILSSGVVTSIPIHKKKEAKRKSIYCLLRQGTSLEILDERATSYSIF